ncbi:MAG: Gfo/Idh/MocA family protein [Mycobacteriales bacterium]
MGLLAVGLVGAGPWAQFVHAPMLAAGPETILAGVWARRQEAAGVIAAPHGAGVAESFEALLDCCDAVAFAVPPDVQAELAIRAARAGKHLLLEKPLALDLTRARELAATAGEAGVITQVVLTARYMPVVREFLGQAVAFGAVGARAVNVSGSALDGPFATPWRVTHGALLDVGPHVLDLLDAALGPIVEVTARGDPCRWTALTCTHDTGAVSEAALSITVPVPVPVSRYELYGAAGLLAFDRLSDPQVAGESFTAAVRTIRAEFAEAVATATPHPLDVHRGLHLQELIDQAMRSLAS